MGLFTAAGTLEFPWLSPPWPVILRPRSSGGGSPLLDSDSPCQPKKPQLRTVFAFPWMMQQTVYPAIYHLSTMFGQGNHHQKMPSKLHYVWDIHGYPVDFQWFSRDVHINSPHFITFLQPPMAHQRLALRRRHFSVARRGESATETATTETAEGAEGEEFEFQAEVGRVMDIIINSLYSNKDCYHKKWNYHGPMEVGGGIKQHGCFEILNLSGNHFKWMIWLSGKRWDVHCQVRLPPCNIEQLLNRFNACQMSLSADVTAAFQPNFTQHAVRAKLFVSKTNEKTHVHVQ